jgi:hypothetical protein
MTAADVSSHDDSIPKIISAISVFVSIVCTDPAGILYALHIRAQKYGFSPIFLLFLQVGQLKDTKLSKRHLK